MLQKVGARTGLLTTRGFRDVLEIGRIRTPGMFDLAWAKPEPLVPRRWRREAVECVAADGGPSARLENCRSHRNKLLEDHASHRQREVNTLATAPAISL